MNERIKELHDLCNVFDDEEMEYNFNHVKFAELIVLECIDIVVEYSEDGAHCQRQMIKERFGVK